MCFSSPNSSLVLATPNKTLLFAARSAKEHAAHSIVTYTHYHRVLPYEITELQGDRQRPTDVGEQTDVGDPTVTVGTLSVLDGGPHTCVGGYSILCIIV